MIKRVKTSEEFKIERDRLSGKYMIEKIHAACYLCNYRDLYFCNQCKNLEKCDCISRDRKRG